MNGAGDLSSTFTSASDMIGQLAASPQVDQLLQQANVEQDQTKRFDVYRQAEQQIVNDAAWLPLIYDKTEVLIKPSVTGYEPSIINLGSGIIIPILVGPAAKISAVAREHRLDACAIDRHHRDLVALGAQGRQISVERESRLGRLRPVPDAVRAPGRAARRRRGRLVSRLRPGQLHQRRQPDGRRRLDGLLAQRDRESNSSPSPSPSWIGRRLHSFPTSVTSSARRSR